MSLLSSYSFVVEGARTIYPGPHTFYLQPADFLSLYLSNNRSNGSEVFRGRETTILSRNFYFKNFIRNIYRKNDTIRKGSGKENSVKWFFAERKRGRRRTKLEHADRIHRTVVREGDGWNSKTLIKNFILSTGGGSIRLKTTPDWYMNYAMVYSS